MGHQDALSKVMSWLHCNRAEVEGVAAIATLTATSQCARLMQGTAGYQKEAAKDARGDEGRGQLLHEIPNYSHPEIDPIRVRLTRYSKTNVFKYYSTTSNVY